MRGGRRMIMAPPFLPPGRAGFPAGAPAMPPLPTGMPQMPFPRGGFAPPPQGQPDALAQQQALAQQLALAQQQALVPSVAHPGLPQPAALAPAFGAPQPWPGQPVPLPAGAGAGGGVTGWTGALGR